MTYLIDELTNPITLSDLKTILLLQIFNVYFFIIIAVIFVFCINMYVRAVILVFSLTLSIVFLFLICNLDTSMFVWWKHCFIIFIAFRHVLVWWVISLLFGWFLLYSNIPSTPTYEMCIYPWKNDIQKLKFLSLFSLIDGYCLQERYY